MFVTKCHIIQLIIFLKCSLFLSCKVIYRLFCCDEQRAIVEVIIFSFSYWLSKANESNEKKEPTDNKLNIKRAPGHYEQKNPFILYKFYDLQSRIANLKSVENLKKEFKRDSVTIKQSPTYLLPEFEIILGNSLAFTIKVYEWLLAESWNVNLTKVTCKTY